MHEADSICTVVNASPFQCRWVTELVTESGLRIFCGQPCPGTAKPWCADHYPLIYIKRGKLDDDLPTDTGSGERNNKKPRR
jgi:hypothetical protein